MVRKRRGTWADRSRQTDWLASLRVGCQELAFHGQSQPPYSLSDQFWRSVRKIQPHVMVHFPGDCIEGVAGDEGYALSNCGFQNLAAVERLRQGHPQEQTALRVSPFHFGRKEFFQSFEHYVATLAVEIANNFHMLFQEAVAHNLVCHMLRES